MSEMCCMRLVKNRLQGAKMTQKPSYAHHRTTLQGYIFATKARIDNRKKTCFCLPRHNMTNFGPCTCGWDRSGSLGHPGEFQRVSRLGRVTAPHSSNGRQPNFAALNRGRHLYSAGRPPPWALAHILVGVISSSARTLYYIFIFIHHFW